ncbi:putative membrane protein [Estrella lausannensis]|uniref:Putative membrane protein n=1 Tax=Estrella lausannensis TaxID=483423 RepID=A0A0H5DQ65_9BACT|nr:putative membrane protein [Estrella lausannensis]
MIVIFWLIPFLCGCVVGPDYRAPRPCIPEWESIGAEASDETPVNEWWALFNDPLLESYIEMAKRYNKDIRIAEASILQARANRQMAASALYPQVIADLNATKTYFSKNGPIFAIGPAAGNPADTPSATTGLPGTVQAPQTQTLFNALMDVSWEIDLFGKNARGVEAAVAAIGRSFEDRNDILLSILAEVAKSYIEVRGMQQRMVLIEENITLLEENKNIVEANYRRGLVSRLDLERSEADLTSLRATLNGAIAEIYKGIYTLSLLTGNFPEALLDEMLPQRPLPELPEDIAVGLRSDLLRRRPDIRRAERNLAVATNPPPPPCQCRCGCRLFLSLLHADRRCRLSIPETEESVRCQKHNLGLQRRCFHPGFSGWKPDRQLKSPGSRTDTGGPFLSKKCADSCF